MSLTIHRNHPVVKLAYLFNGQAPPSRTYWNGTEHVYGPAPTSLCPLFWRCVLTIVGVLGFATLVSLFLGFLGWRLYHTPWSVYRVVLMITAYAVVGSLAVIGLIALSLKFQWGQKLADAADATAGKLTDSVVWETAKSVKSKVCPMVSFTESREA